MFFKGIVGARRMDGVCAAVQKIWKREKISPRGVCEFWWSGFSGSHTKMCILVHTISLSKIFCFANHDLRTHFFYEKQKKFLFFFISTYVPNFLGKPTLVFFNILHRHLHRMTHLLSRPLHIMYRRNIFVFFRQIHMAKHVTGNISPKSLI